MEKISGFCLMKIKFNDILIKINNHHNTVPGVTNARTYRGLGVGQSGEPVEQARLGDKDSAQVQDKSCLGRALVLSTIACCHVGIQAQSCQTF